MKANELGQALAPRKRGQSELLTDPFSTDVLEIWVGRIGSLRQRI